MTQYTGVQWGKYRGFMSRYLGPLWLQLSALAALIVAGIGLQVWAPQVMRAFIDLAVAGAGFELLLRTAALYTGLMVSRQMLGAMGRYLGEDIGWKATNSLRFDLTRHCLDLDMSFHKAHSAGELVERIDGDAGSLAELFSQFTAGIAANVLFLAGTLFVLFRMSWIAGLAVAAASSVSLIILWRMRATAAPLWAKVRESFAEVYGGLGEWMQGMEDIRSCGATGWVLKQFHQFIRRWYSRHRKAMMARFGTSAAGLFMFSTGTAIALAVSASLLLKGQITLGTAFAIFTYAEMIRTPLEQIGGHLRSMQTAGGSLDRVSALLATSSSLVSAETPRERQALPGGPLSVEFADVSFAYEPGGEEVLAGVNFRIRPGRVLGILGRTGSGKTTIARLLFRFNDPVSGEVRLNGVRTPELDLAELRRRVGLVTQDVQVFQASLRDNVTFFDQSVPDSAVTAILSSAGLGTWLATLPRGLDTLLGPGGTGLSAGEAQLLAFARVGLRDPGLVILDEASSRLDSASESNLETAIETLLRRRTGVIIAHRLSTLNRADDVLVVEDGRVTESGERSVLAGDPHSRYAQLLAGGIEEVLP